MICTEYDQFLREKDKTVWVCDIEIHPYSHGIITNKQVFQDDGRPGLDEPKAWVRLKEYMALGRRGSGDGHIRIKRIHCQFRDHIETIPLEYPNGVYFSYGAGGNMFSPHTENYYVLGVVEGDRVHKYWYRVPEVILYDETWDEIPPVEDARLIMNDGTYQS